MPESPTSPRRLAIAEKQRLALQLRLAGATPTEIAKQLGYSNHSGAIVAIKAALKRTLEPAASEFRAITLERITAVMRAFWPQMLRGDERAAVVVLRSIKDQRELLGLDAPQRQEVTGADGGPIRIEDARAELLTQINLISVRLGEGEGNQSPPSRNGTGPEI